MTPATQLRTEPLLTDRDRDQIEDRIRLISEEILPVLATARLDPDRTGEMEDEYQRTLHQIERLESLLRHPSVG